MKTSKLQNMLNMFRRDLMKIGNFYKNGIKRGHKHLTPEIRATLTMLLYRYLRIVDNVKSLYVLRSLLKKLRPLNPLITFWYSKKHLIY